MSGRSCFGPGSASSQPVWCWWPMSPSWCNTPSWISRVWKYISITVSLSKQTTRNGSGAYVCCFFFCPHRSVAHPRRGSSGFFITTVCRGPLRLTTDNCTTGFSSPACRGQEEIRYLRLDFRTTQWRVSFFLVSSIVCTVHNPVIRKNACNLHFWVSLYGKTISWAYTLLYFIILRQHLTIYLMG